MEKIGSLPVVTPTSLGALPWLVAFTTQAPNDFSATQGDAQGGAQGDVYGSRDGLARGDSHGGRDALARALAPLALTWLHLEHGGRVVSVPDAGAGRGARGASADAEHAMPAPAASAVSPTADAALVVQSGFAAALTTADCVPLIVACPSKRVAAVIHAGWRGLAAGVIENALDALAKHIGGLPGDTLVWIGPAIQQEHYEIGPEVRHDLLQSAGVSAAHFKEAGADRTHPRQSTRAAAKKYLADLPAIAVAKLTLKGIATENIEVYPHSTFSHTYLHSVRRDGTQAGRMATVVGILPSNRRTFGV